MSDRLDKIRFDVQAEVNAMRAKLNKVSVDEVNSLHKDLCARYGVKDAFQGLRTELSGMLQSRNPPPLSPDGELLKTGDPEYKEYLHDENRAQVSDRHRILSDQARALDKWHTDAHHFVQKLHGMAIWAEVDRMIAEAGILQPVGA